MGDYYASSDYRKNMAEVMNREDERSSTNKRRIEAGRKKDARAPGEDLMREPERISRGKDLWTLLKLAVPW